MDTPRMNVCRKMKTPRDTEYMNKYYATATGLYSDKDWGGPPPMPYDIVYKADEVDQKIRDLEIQNGLLTVLNTVHDRKYKQISEALDEVVQETKKRINGHK